MVKGGGVMVERWWRGGRKGSGMQDHASRSFKLCCMHIYIYIYIYIYICVCVCACVCACVCVFSVKTNTDPFSRHEERGFD